MTTIRNNTLPSPSEGSEEGLAEIRAELGLWLQKHRGLIDIFLDAYCIVDVSNHVVDFNVAFTELCGESYRKIMKIGNFCELLRTELCPGQCPAIQVITSQKALRLDEVRGSSKAFGHLQMIVGGIPIFSESGKILGSLITIRNVSAETELQKKYEERKQESVMDGLTRLYNKVFTESMLLRFIKQSQRDPHLVSIAMCDIDHFKKVNDTYGHQAGDYVLSLVAQMLKGESRDTDVAGRFGGEEFIVLLPRSDVAGAKIFSERFRKRVEQTQIRFEGRQIPVTVSLGTATFSDKWLAEMNAEQAMKELVSRADTALYFAKSHGRNQSCQFETVGQKENLKPPPEKTDEKKGK